MSKCYVDVVSCEALVIVIEPPYHKTSSNDCR